VGGEKPTWRFCSAVAVAGKPYCPAHLVECCMPVAANLEKWIEAQMPKEAKAKRIRFAKSALLW
jgi:hypothetical protein